MNNRAKKYLMISGFVAVIIFVWFIRETLFVYTNAQISVLEFGNEPFNFFPGMGFLGEMELNSLYTFKWLMTLVFFMLFWLLAVLCLYLFYNAKKLYKYVHVTYAVILLLSGASILAAKLLGGTAAGEAYSFARLLMGAGQSPLVLMILLPVLRLAQKNQ